MQTAGLPQVDEHDTAVAADPETVYAALAATVAEGFSARHAAAYARLVGCVPAEASGSRPLAEGSTVPGFRVATAVPGRELALEGRHRFSTYALRFRVEAAGPGRSTLRAESRAAFPGLPGAAYRLVVVGTGLHAVAVRRLLAGVRRRAERA